MSIRIRDLNHDGRGRGTDGNRTFLISQALPGDSVEVRVDRSSTTTVQGRVRARLEYGPGHRDHPCPHADRCTGCPLLPASETVEDAFKLSQLEGWLAGVDPALPSTVRPLERPSGSFGYRHYAKQVLAQREGGLVAGSYVAGTHHVEDNRCCPVLAPALAALVERARVRLDGLPVHEGKRLGLRHLVARLARASGELLLVVVTSGEIEPVRERLDGLEGEVGCFAISSAHPGNRILSGDAVHLGGPLRIRERLLGHDHWIGPTGFFQINPVAAERLFEIALDAAGEGERCVEGYAGVGALTLSLRERFERVVTNELNAEALDGLRRRAPDVEAHAGDAEQVLPELLRTPCDAVVLDPPRKGLGAVVAEAVAQSPTRRIVLLSCDPKSLTRDLPILLRRFDVRSITPVDQFPRTAHFETVTVLEARH